MTCDAEESAASIGWVRAILTAAVIAVVGIVVLVYGTNAVMTTQGHSRSTLVAVATTMFFVLLLLLAWALRRLQARRVI